MISLILQPYSRQGTKITYPFQTNYFQCRNVIAIVVQHALTKPISYSILLLIHWPLLLQPIPNQNCLISISYPRLNCLKTTPFAAAHTHIAYTNGSAIPPEIDITFWKPFYSFSTTVRPIVLFAQPLLGSSATPLPHWKGTAAKETIGQVVSDLHVFRKLRQCRGTRNLSRIFRCR